MTEATAQQSLSQPETLTRERLLWILSAATFLIFFQAYMVAPLIPRLATVFGVSVERIGLIVPAYLIPYGVSTLVYGVISDRIGRRSIMLTSLTAFILLTAATGFVHSSTQLLTLRLLTGVGASGVVPLALALIGDLFPYRERGRPLGWLFGAMAGGMAIGSTAGVLSEPFVGWPRLFFGVSALGLILLLALLPYWDLLGGASEHRPAPLRAIIVGYKKLLGTARGLRTYAYVLLNAVFHSGVFTWLGLYFARRYRLGEVGIGLALLGYGVPGFLLGPLVGRLADRVGRRWLIPLGLMLAGATAAALALDLPVIAAGLLVTLLSLGYDLTQPLLAGIVTDLGPQRGQAMGLNVFTLFVGFGLGSLVFSATLELGFGFALATFGAVVFFAGLTAVYLFRLELPHQRT